MDIGLSIVTAPAIEPVTVAQVQEHLRLDQNADPIQLGMMITAARMLCEEFLARALITQELLYTHADRGPTTLPGLVLPLLTFPVSIGGPTYIPQTFELPRSPVQSVSSVSVTDYAGNQSTLASSSYTLDTSLEPARIVVGIESPNPVQRIQIDFIAGYGASASAVPMPIIYAILMTVANLYENRGDVEGSGIPEVAYTLMRPYRVWNFGG